MMNEVRDRIGRNHLAWRTFRHTGTDVHPVRRERLGSTRAEPEACIHTGFETAYSSVGSAKRHPFPRDAQEFNSLCAKCEPDKYMRAPHDPPGKCDARKSAKNGSGRTPLGARPDCQLALRETSSSTMSPPQFLQFGGRPRLNLALGT